MGQVYHGESGSSWNRSNLSRRKWIGRYLSYLNSLSALKFWCYYGSHDAIYLLIVRSTTVFYSIYRWMYDAVEIYFAQYFLFDEKLSGCPIALKRVSCWRMTSVTFDKNTPLRLHFALRKVLRILFYKAYLSRCFFSKISYYRAHIIYIAIKSILNVHLLY